MIFAKLRNFRIEIKMPTKLRRWLFGAIFLTRMVILGQLQDLFWFKCQMAIASAIWIYPLPSKLFSREKLMVSTSLTAPSPPI